MNKIRARLVNVKQGELVAIKPDDLIVYRGDLIDDSGWPERWVSCKPGEGDVVRVTGKQISSSCYPPIHGPILSNCNGGSLCTCGPTDYLKRPVWHWQRVEGGV